MALTNDPLKTFVINLKHRNERKVHILKEFYGRDEFSVTITEACEHPRGFIGLWQSIVNVIRSVSDDVDEYILICEDDHQFTDFYTWEILFESIEQAKQLQADILCGGVSWLNNALQVTDNLFWIEDNFSGTQFIVLFRKIFQTILSATLGDTETPDMKFCSLSDKIFLIHPFISVQKEFGYSDATMPNNAAGRVESLFKNAEGSIGYLRQIRQHYKQVQLNLEKEPAMEEANDDFISTYIIGLPGRTDRKGHIRKQFQGRNEFDVTFMEPGNQETGPVGLWMCIRRIIEIAKSNEEDVIIICKDGHEFTSHYSKKLLFRNIMEAHAEGNSYLFGGVAHFGAAVPISQNRYWVNVCTGSQFIVVFNNVFDRILAEPVSENIMADMTLSVTSNGKTVLYPFISGVKEFDHPETMPALFSESSKRFENLLRRNTGSL